MDTGSKIKTSPLCVDTKGPWVQNKDINYLCVYKSCPRIKTVALCLCIQGVPNIRHQFSVWIQGVPDIRHQFSACGYRGSQIKNISSLCVDTGGPRLKASVLCVWIQGSQIKDISYLCVDKGGPRFKTIALCLCIQGVPNESAVYWDINTIIQRFWEDLSQIVHCPATKYRNLRQHGGKMLFHIFKSE